MESTKSGATCFFEMECSICASPSRKTSLVSCPACEYTACKTCLKTFFGTLPEPTCPNCKIIWTREFISTKFRSFQKQYLKIREKYLLDKELAKLPETQPVVEQELMVRDLELRAQSDPSLRQVAIDARIAHNQMVAERSYAPPQVSMKCPNEPDCRGFICAETGKCGLCPTIVCKICTMTINVPYITYLYDCKACGKEIHTIDVQESFNDICPKCEKNEDVSFHKHVCKTEDIETAKLLKRDTRPCPTCAVPIFKIDGCDQMWCIQCKTAFSWVTGLVETGRVHNPHFYEWQRRRGDIPREDDDGCIVYIEHLVAACQPASLKTYIEHFHALVFNVIPHQIERPFPPDNQDLRIKYLLNELSKTRFAGSVQRRDKKYQKDLEVFQILDVLCSGAHKIFRDICILSRELQSQLSNEQLIPFIRQLEDLRLFINNQLNIVGKVYQIKNKLIVPYFIDSMNDTMTSADGDSDTGKHLENLTSYLDPSSFKFNRHILRIEFWISDK